jgi:hypothetical protein
LPNADTHARQQQTATTLLAFSVSRACDGCNPNTVMSINWRASLVPAAAVIPAPRAYTNIAAVKTLVVCHWVQVCQVASVLWCGACLGSVPPAVCWKQPLAVCSCTHSPPRWGDLLLLEVPFSGGQGNVAPKACWAAQGCGPCHTDTLAHHRSPPSQTPW